MVIPNLSESNIRYHASEKTFDRGQRYFRNGSVGALVQRGNELSAQVEGSEANPNRISVHFDQGGISSATCSCLYDFEGWCKHIVASLLNCLHQPEQIEQRSELNELLAPLSREQLEKTLQQLALVHPDWIDEIEQQISQLTRSQTSVSTRVPRRTTVDPKPIQQQVKQILKRYEGQWNDDPAFNEIRDLMQKATPFLEQSDGNNALIILGAITRAYVKDWMNLDGSSGESGEFFLDLDEALPEAILSAELSEHDRQKWQSEIEIWHDKVHNYGIASFDMSLTALKQGWEYSPLKQALRGELTEQGIWGNKMPKFAESLALTRLKILERRGEYQEYLNLAKAEGQTRSYLQMLAKLGRTEEAISQAQQRMETADEALTLAQALREQGELEQALNIATQGLSMKGYGKHRLAIWLTELADGMGEQAIGLQAIVTAFKSNPSLQGYLKVKELAGDQWNSLRKEFLAKMRRASNNLYAAEKVAIFLHEGLMDAAISTVDKLSSYESSVIYPVMDAAVAYRPDWVIENAHSRAESIINGGKAKYYYHAVNWLRRVRAAYLHQGQLEEWSQYKTALIQAHTRKRKFVSLMQHRDLA